MERTIEGGPHSRGGPEFRRVAPADQGLPARARYRRGNAGRLATRRDHAETGPGVGGQSLQSVEAISNNEDVLMENRAGAHPGPHCYLFAGEGVRWGDGRGLTPGDI
jgi:hypothetical protein